MTRSTPLPRTTMSPARGIGYVLIAAVAWGTSGAAATILYDTSDLGPVAVSFWRFAAGAVLLTAVHVGLSGRRPRRGPGPGQWRRAVLIGAGLAVYQTAYFAGVRYAGLALATVVTLGAGPVLIALGSRYALGERLGRAGVAGVTVALFGLLLLVSGGTASPVPAPALGLACALLSALGYAAVTLVNRHLSRRDPQHSPHLTVWGGFTAGMLFLAPLAVAEGLLPAPADRPETWLLLGYLGAVPTALAYGLFFAALATVRATTASMLALIESVTAAVIGAVWFGERLTATAVAGAVALLGSLAVLAFGERGPGRIGGGPGRTSGGRGRTAGLTRPGHHPAGQVSRSVGYRACAYPFRSRSWLPRRE